RAVLRDNHPADGKAGRRALRVWLIAVSIEAVGHEWLVIRLFQGADPSPGDQPRALIARVKLLLCGLAPVRTLVHILCRAAQWGARHKGKRRHRGPQHVQSMSATHISPPPYFSKNGAARRCGDARLARGAMSKTGFSGQAPRYTRTSSNLLYLARSCEIVHAGKLDEGAEVVEPFLLEPPWNSTASRLATI